MAIILRLDRMMADDLILAAILYLISFIFEYGISLQTEVDETL